MAAYEPRHTLPAPCSAALADSGLPKHTANQETSFAARKENADIRTCGWRHTKPHEFRLTYNAELRGRPNRRNNAKQRRFGLSQ